MEFYGKGTYQDNLEVLKQTNIDQVEKVRAFRKLNLINLYQDCPITKSPKFITTNIKTKITKKEKQLQGYFKNPIKNKLRIKNAIDELEKLNIILAEKEAA